MEGRIWADAKIGIGPEAPLDVKLKQIALMAQNRFAISSMTRDPLPQIEKARQDRTKIP